MTIGIERRQRWAAFSVRAHRDIGSLASDILLYDRIILPVPADEPEFDRWVRANWDPEQIAPRIVQSAGHIVPVPWTAPLRDEWSNRMESLRTLGNEVGYGLTGVVMACYPPAWAEIAAGLDPDQVPERKPAIMAGFQSAEEAQAEMGLVPAGAGRVPAASSSKSLPGGRPVDLTVALHIRRMVHEPDLLNPEEAFNAAVSLAENPRFQSARRSLFDWEDNLFVDGWEPEEVENKLPALEEEYRDAVRAVARVTRMRLVATLLPKAAGYLVGMSGIPYVGEISSKSLSLVGGHFIAHEDPFNPDTLPGAALHMIRAAYRNQHPEPTLDALGIVEALVD